MYIAYKIIVAPTVAKVQITIAMGADTVMAPLVFPSSDWAETSVSDSAGSEEEEEEEDDAAGETLALEAAAEEEAAAAEALTELEAAGEAAVAGDFEALALLLLEVGDAEGVDEEEEEEGLPLLLLGWGNAAPEPSMGPL